MARTGTLKFTVTCAKFAGFGKAVREYCFLHNLKCNIQETKGIIFCDYFVTLEGDKDALIKARKDTIEALEDYQNNN